MGEAAFFTDAARKRVTEAVVDVESRTAAEVVVVVRYTSDAWRAVDLAAGAAVAFAVLLLLLVAAIPIDVALGFAAGAVLCAGIAPLKRALLPTRRVTARVHAAACQAFVEQGISRTRGRTGVLVYVSTFERRVEVVPDVGVDPKDLDAPVRALRDAVARGADFDAFVEALRGIGPSLERPLPRAADDVNELPDAPVMP